MTSATADATATSRATTPIRMEVSDRLPIARIHPSKTNPRTHFDDAYIKDDLAVSIRDKGIIQPLVVRPHPKKPDDVEIVAGECRYRAALIVGLDLLPVVIRDYTDMEVLEIQIEENTHRKDLTPLEEGAAYRRLITMDPDKHSAMSIATRIGKSPTYVWDYLKLNDLIPEAKHILEAERMAVGHAILIARLKPEDQERAIDADAGRDARYGAGVGLWTTDHSGLLDDVDDEDAEIKKNPYFGLKTVSVRELESWIRDHVRFDVAHAAKAQPLVFEETAFQVEQAALRPGRGKKVISITNEYRVADDARDEKERTYGSQSWQRADGQEKSKTCEYSALGVFAAGDRYGETLEVCVARDKCLVHFGEVVRAKQKAAKQREAGQTKKAAKTEKKAEESSDAKYKREQAQRTERERAWAAIAKPITAEAVAQVKGVKTLTAAQGKALLAQGGELGATEIKQHLGVSWFKSPAAALLISAVTYFHFNSYSEKTSGFDQFVKEIATPFGLDVKRLEAIRDKHQPKAAAAPAKKGAAA